MAENRTGEDEEFIEVDETESDVEDTEDGGAIVKMDDGEATRAASEEHFANLVDEVDQAALSVIVSELLDKIELDKKAREKRDKLYEEGLRRTGMGDDAPGGAQFTGATKVVHPMLIEGCVDFSARVMKELMPPNGPVRTKMYGQKTTGKIDKAQRKADFLNWQLTEQIQAFRTELEQLTTQLPLGGGQYLKFWRNNERKRIECEFVPIDDVFLPFAASNFYTANRKTHRQYVTAQEFEQRVAAGMYRDITLTSVQEPEFSKASKANDKIEGRTMSQYNEDGLRIVYEIYVLADVEGNGPAPYIISIDDNTSQALAVYRNWDIEDATKEQLVWMVEFPMIPWRGAYPIGLTHLIGGLTTAATGALRALMDSAHIQNFPTALKLKGGPNGQTINLQPTQLAEIEGGPMADDIRKLVMQLPFPGPSPTLFQLLGFLVDAGKGVIQTSFEKLADGNPNAPVGTTLALIEQGMVVFSSIHSRLHNAMAMVLKVIHRINRDYLTQEDIDAAGDFELTPDDFQGPMDVIPVSDPNIFSEAQRFAQTQAVLQRADAKPQLYDARKVEEMFLKQLKIPTDILVQGTEPENMDPASENIAAVMGSKIFVLPRQDQIAHLMVHIPFVLSPVFGGNPVMSQTLIPPMIEHLRNHVLQYYVTESHRAVRKAVEDELVGDDDAKAQAQVVNLVQQEVEPVMANVAKLIAYLQSLLPPMPPGNMPPPDPRLAIAQMNQQIDQQRLKQEAEEAFAALQLKQQEMQNKAAERQIRMQEQANREMADLQKEQMRQAAEDRRTAAEIESRERMNLSDNQTALTLAEAEIRSGERFAVSTGTGINPQP
jgi:chaperonin GroES